MKRTLLTLSLVGLLFTGWYGYRLVLGTPLNINHFADRTSLFVVSHFPEMITRLGFVENSLLDFHSDRLSDHSSTTQDVVAGLHRDGLQQLAHYDRQRLSGQQALTYDYLDWSWSARSALYAFPYHFYNLTYSGPYPANQMDGAQNLVFSTLSQYQQVVDEASAERYLARVAAMPATIESLQVAMEERAELGVIPPQVVMEKLIAQAQVLATKPAAEWSPQVALEKHLAAIELDDVLRSELLARNLAVIESAVIPAYAAYYEYLRELALEAPAAVGMWSLPDGLAYYDALLRYNTTTDMSAAEIHALGLQRVADVRAQMDAVLLELGFTEGSYTERLLAFAQSPEMLWQERPGVREEILAEYDRLNQELQAATAVLFRDVPPQPLVVRAVPAEEEIGSAGAYYNPPALDGSRPGIFFVNLYNPADTQRFAMRTLSAHEGVPGHHFQTSFAQLVTGVPLVRKTDYISAYSEGWALYTERLVFELGLHDNASNLGRLQAEMFRAVRLVVDTGIHAQRWTRQQAIDYMRDNTGMTEGEVVTEIERYIVLPGQACSYMIGMLEILRLREEAMQRQGDRFKLPDFHHAVLKNGDLPLTLLRREVEAALQ